MIPPAGNAETKFAVFGSTTNPAACGVDEVT
jgi:hypothetical protein